MHEPSALDRAYSPSLLARDPAGSLRQYRVRSDAARARLDVQESVPYGTGTHERCHVFVADHGGTASGTPVLMFVHGGHWQESGIADACFAAERTVAQGCAYVAISYGLAPQRTLPEMITSVRTSLSWLAENGPRYGIDPDRIHVAGSSAGAHLLAAALSDGTAPRIRSACLISGLYDLSEITRTYVNDTVGLTPGLARACSPLGKPAPRCSTVVLAVGEHETPTYHRQQSAFAAHLRALGVEVTARTLPDRDHFDLPLDLADPATPFGRLSLMPLARSAPSSRRNGDILR